MVVLKTSREETPNDIVTVVRDIEKFLDSLLSHSKEENCTHSVNDLLKEFFDKRTGAGASTPTEPTIDLPQHSRQHGGQPV